MCSDGGNRGTSLLQRIKHRVGEELSVPPRTAKERFRHELKYLISYAQKADLNVRVWRRCLASTSMRKTAAI